METPSCDVEDSRKRWRVSWPEPVARAKGMVILAMAVVGGGLGSLAQGNPIRNDGTSNHDEAARRALERRMAWDPLR